MKGFAKMGTTKKGNDFLQYLLFDNGDDEDEADLQLLSLIAVYSIDEQKKQMSRKRRREQEQNGVQGTTPAASSNTIFVCIRLEWDLHVTHLLEEGPNAFSRLYRMEYASFVKLCGLIMPFVSIDARMSKVRTRGKSPITVEIILHCLLRWLAGGSYLDI